MFKHFFLASASLFALDAMATPEGVASELGLNNLSREEAIAIIHNPEKVKKIKEKQANPLFKELTNKEFIAEMEKNPTLDSKTIGETVLVEKVLKEQGNTNPTDVTDAKELLEATGEKFTAPQLVAYKATKALTNPAKPTKDQIKAMEHAEARGFQATVNSLDILGDLVNLLKLIPDGTATELAAVTYARSNGPLILDAAEEIKALEMLLDNTKAASHIAAPTKNDILGAAYMMNAANNIAPANLTAANISACGLLMDGNRPNMHVNKAAPSLDEIEAFEVFQRGGAFEPTASQFDPAVTAALDIATAAEKQASRELIVKTIKTHARIPYAIIKYATAAAGPNPRKFKLIYTTDPGLVIGQNNIDNNGLFSITKTNLNGIAGGPADLDKFWAVTGLTAAGAGYVPQGPTN